MKFIALLPVRDEDDIVEQCLRTLLTWADSIYVFDTGSVDDTWEIVKELASVERRIVPTRREPVFYSEPRVRGYLFDCARKQMRNGDWFARVDADEFHHIQPPQFVSRALRRQDTVVYHQYYDFRLLKSEVQRWEHGEETLADRARDIAERRQFYSLSMYSEPRLCRYRDTMKWPQDCSFPVNAGFVAPERIPIRHYPHRDPVQLARRSKLRAIMLNDPENQKHWTHPELHHWSIQDWRTFVTPDDHPGLLRWQPGETLPSFRLGNHLQPKHIRCIQRILHSIPLGLLDRTRPSFPGELCLQRIPPELQAYLRTTIGDRA